MPLFNQFKAVFMVERVTARFLSCFRLGNSVLLQGKVRTLWSSSTMSKDHLQVTKDCSRIPLIHPAIVDSVYDISPTVKELNVTVNSVNDQEFTFLPGQWVDMFIPGVEKVGGFSITSTPKYFQQTRQIKLAVKFSTWPPAHWVHTKCQDGSKIELRSGGDFALNEVDPDANYIFVAGGVGINPIASMIQHLKDAGFKGRISLLFSVQSMEELIFKDTFDEILSEDSEKGLVKYFVTRKHENGDKRTGILFNRLSLEDIKACLAKSKSLMYVCGPPSMIQTVLDAKLPDVTLFHENWWA